MRNLEFLRRPFAAMEFVSSSEWALNFQEEGYGATQVYFSERSYGSICEFLSGLAYAMSGASPSGSFYAAYLDSTIGRVVIERTGAGSNFALYWADDSSRRALGGVLGFDFERMDFAYEAKKTGAFAPRYAWLPKSPMASMQIEAKSGVICSRDYKGGAVVTALPKTLKRAFVSFETLTRDLVYESGCEKGSFESFWEEAKGGKRIFLFTPAPAVLGEFEILAVEEDTPSEGLYKLTFNIEGSRENFLNGSLCAIAEGKGKGVLGRVSGSGYAPGGLGFAILKRGDWLLPEAGGSCAFYSPPLIGRLDEENGELRVSRMNVGAEFYKVSLSMTIEE